MTKIKISSEEFKKTIVGYLRKLTYSIINEKKISKKDASKEVIIFLRNIAFIIAEDVGLDK